MDHIAIDLGSRTSQICVRDAQGQIVDEQSYTTRHLGTYLRRRPAGQGIVETSSEAFGVARMAQAAGHQVSVVQPERKSRSHTASGVSVSCAHRVGLRRMPQSDSRRSSRRQRT